MLTPLERLKKEINEKWPQAARRVTPYYMFEGYAEHFDSEVPIARAYAVASVFRKHRKHVYDNDMIAGSIRGAIEDESVISNTALQHAQNVCANYGSRHFGTNFDHYAPDYETFLSDGIKGTLEKIEKSKLVHKGDKKKQVFLEACEISMQAFSDMVRGYSDKALERAEAFEKGSCEYENLMKVYETCKKVSYFKPETFREALQLVWFVHTAFLYEGRYAMALGRLDQYLYPYYKKDIEEGRINDKEALDLLSCTLYKIYECRYFGGDDVVNIAIGGVLPNGLGGVNELSYLILKAVEICNVPGPNLSARIYSGIPEGFLDECLKVIGTGLGYPALMNDDVNVPALLRHGYSIEDARNYCMVGCIENFIPGKQPPWSDGRFNSPKYIELVLNNGVCMHTGVRLGPSTGDVSELKTMDDFLHALRKQLEHGAAMYVRMFKNENERYNTYNYMQPFLSCFCYPCIERGLDINDGGALYPSVHGAACMGIGTFADSLAAVEMFVYNKREIDLSLLKEAILNNFEGYEEVLAKVLSAPKYGNDDDFVDKYAKWFVNVHYEIFSKYKTHDGGAFYIAIAANISNIYAGMEIAATPDGRRDGEPLSDAASPVYGRDVHGPTLALKSLTKPDYTKVSCGTVVNQKYTRNMFTDPVKRKKLLDMIKVYLKNGGQEIQINAVSKEILIDAMKNPENYTDLVVRVSGFSAYYNSLSNEVKLDILRRTEHG
ncbi:MAG TPA: pyruvate formate lyase family protein [Clostridia bacterium]|jgi:pyruvate-formate lyase|nr:pyruvate formate lyase family protein [Clostridia bacterium]HPZ51760.1 pyruvate formate lyase family protein [Clostridia bacterium]